MAVRSLAATLVLAASAFARTDLVGCTYTDTVVQPSGLPGYDAYASRIWYVPGTGELCDFLDCGGGMAPPKTDVPGCPLYSGTATYSPSYLSLQTKAAAEGAGTATVTVVGTTVHGSAQVTPKATTAPATTLVTSSVSDTESESASAPTTAAPAKSSSASSSTASASKGLSTGAPGRNSTGTGPSGPAPTNGAAPAAVAILGSCLMAGVVACVGML